MLRSAIDIYRPIYNFHMSKSLKSVFKMRLRKDPHPAAALIIEEFLRGEEGVVQVLRGRSMEIFKLTSKKKRRKSGG